MRQHLEVVDAALDTKVAKAVERGAPYLDNALGPRPDNPKKGREWERDATTIEGYRHRVLGFEPETGAVEPGSALQAAIGGEPDDLAAAMAWREVARRLDRQRAVELDRGLGIDL